MPALIDLTGKTFGRLVVLGRAPDSGEKVTWLCRCSCGNLCVAIGTDMKAGKHRSCGCLRVELHLRHGHTHHGKPPSPEYRTWIGMVQRCTNPRATKYKNYGGRGIKVCERWRTFDNFLADMGIRPSLKHTLDRINNDGDYEPSNCRWATEREQRANTRRGAPSSEHLGVHWHKGNQKWMARVTVGGERHYLGLFPTELEAAEAAREGRRRLMPFATD